MKLPPRMYHCSAAAAKIGHIIPIMSAQRSRPRELQIVGNLKRRGSVAMYTLAITTVATHMYTVHTVHTANNITTNYFLFYLLYMETKYTSACGACGPAVSAIASCAGEFGPEWVFDGPGECNMCQFNCTDFGFLGTACTVGTKAKCRRVSYLGDKTSCCLGNGTGNADKRITCDPALGPASVQCNPAYTAYCAVGDRIMSDPKCIAWKNQQPGAARATIQNYCVNNIGDPRCRAWCSNVAAAGDGTCDTAVRAWCELNPADQYCACIKSPLQNPKLGVNPKCNDAKCLAGGYLTQNMMMTACPDITDCSILIPMSNSGVQLAGVNVTQTCGNKPVVTGSTGLNNGTTVTPTGPTGGSSAAPAAPISTQLILVLLVLIAIIVSVVAFFYADPFNLSVRGA